MISSLPLRKIQGLQPAPPGDVWPFTIPSVRSILEDGLIFAPITVIVGENGAGKSVLLESVAEAFGFPLEGGSLAEQRESIEGKSALGDYLQLVRGASRTRDGLFFRAETAHSFQDFLASRGSDRGKALLNQSHGESSLALIGSSTVGQGLWILDEPESGLSFQGQLTLLQLLLDHVRAEGQVILCTHSPVLMAVRGALLLEIGEWGIRPTEYEELESVALWRSFLQAPERFMRHF